MCSACPDREPYKTTPWFDHIWKLTSLQRAGYPFDKNDLSLAEWIAIGEMKAAIDEPPEIPKR